MGTRETGGNGTKASAHAELFTAPSVDIVDSPDQGKFEIVADLPGIDEASLDVSVRERELTIVAKRALTSESGDELWNFESAQRSYRRVFSLDEDVDVDGISASYSAGVLVVEIPKVRKAQPRKIDVKVVQ